MTDQTIPRGKYRGQELDAPVRAKNDHFYRCEKCGALVDYRDLGQVFDHEGQLPHPKQDQPQ